MLEEKLMNINPIIRRHVISQFRQGKLAGITLAGFFLPILICIFNLLFLYGNHPYRPFDIREVSRNTYIWLLAIQFFLYFAFGINSIGMSVVSEKETHTYEFFKTLPLKYREILLGKAIGPNILLHYVELIMVPFVLVAGWLANIPFVVTLQIYLLLAFLIFFISSLGIFVSLIVMRRAAVNLTVLGAVVILGLTSTFFAETYREYGANFLSLFSPVTIFRYYLNPYFRWGQSYQLNGVISFYALKVPILLYTCLVYALLGTAFICGASKKIKNEQAPPFRRKIIIPFFLGFELLLLGFMKDIFSINNQQGRITSVSSLLFFFCIGWFVLFFLGLLLTPDYQNITLWAKNRTGTARKFIRSLLSEDTSPVLFNTFVSFLIMGVIGLFTYAYLFAVYGAPIIQPGMLSRILLALAILLTYLLLYLSMAQFIILKTRNNYTLYAIFLVSALVLPLLLTAFSEKPIFLLYNPISAAHYVVLETFSRAIPKQQVVLSIALPFLLFIIFVFEIRAILQRMQQKTKQTQ